MVSNQQNISSSDLISHHKPYEIGAMKESSTISDLEIQKEEENIQSTISNENCQIHQIQSQLIKESLSSMEELVPSNKRKILNDKSTTSQNCIQTIQSSLISGQVLTLTAKDFKPFWNESAKEWSEKLWLCTEIDLQELELKSWNTYSTCLVQNSWFNVKVKTMKTMTENMTTLSPLSQCLSRVITENVPRETGKDEEKKLKKLNKIEQENQERALKKEEGMTLEDMDRIMKIVEKRMHYEDLYKNYNDSCGMTKTKVKGHITRLNNKIKHIEQSYEQIVFKPSKEEETTNLLRARKIKVQPTGNDKKILDDWFNAARFVYNQCVSYSRDIGNQDLIDMKVKDRLNLFRDHIAKIKFEPENEWLKSVHNVIVDGAITDFCKAYKINVSKKFSQLKKGENFTFTMHFRSKRFLQQETIHVHARDWLQVKGEFAFIRKIKSSEELPGKLESELNISRTRFGEYYYSIVESKNLEQSCYNYSVIALDPGVRTFQTGYDINGVSIEFGKNDSEHLYRLSLHGDKLKSMVDKESNKRRKISLHRAWLRLLLRIRRKVDDMHKKLCTFLCRCYKIILLPELKSSKLITRAKRDMDEKNVRKILLLSHYKFRELLKAKAQTFSGCTLIICDEQYTSKTCGNLHASVGKSKVYSCCKCGKVFDRDINAARNILIRFLTLNKIDLPDHLRSNKKMKTDDRVSFSVSCPFLISENIN